MKNCLCILLKTIETIFHADGNAVDDQDEISSNKLSNLIIKY